ncbi:MAG: hypothetical protein U0974_09245 [Gemmatimonadales bacterium]|nr:hypothetical protein [Gemmatimonadales bacterium]
MDLVHSDGSPLSPRVAKAFRDENADRIQGFLTRASERWNAGIDEILGTHLSTPHPLQALQFEPRLFLVPKPAPFVPRKAGLLGLLWPPRRKRIEEENETRRRDWDALVLGWQEERRGHVDLEAGRERDYRTGRHSDVEAMERVFEDRLALLTWPRETEVSYQIRDSHRVLWLDVDFPEVEDMPREQASSAARGLKLNVRNKSDAQVRREYMQHIHAVLFRLLGEAFHSLPTLQEVVASGYSQRADPTTGHIRDDYLISVKVNRDAWSKLNFQNLEALDVVASFERFDLRRKMTKTGIFTPIDPHVEGEA